jgi:hypothetical protein
MRGLLERAFVEPFRQLAGHLESVLPALVIVLVIIVVGGAIAWLARLLVKWLLDAIHFDRLMERSGMAGAVERTGIFRSPADFGARLVQGFLWVFIILFALIAAETQMTHRLVERFVNYLPDVLAAALVLVLGALISRFLARSALLAAVNAQWPAARVIAGTVRVMVMLLAVVVALEQLRIGSTTLLLTFGILFAGIVIAAAIAFGLGARDLARSWLESKLRPGQREEEETFKHL